MSSSDSEDDCYGNVAQKLQKMKNSYKYEKDQSSNVLDDSSEIDKILKSAGSEPKPSSSSVTDVALPSTSDSLNNSNDDIELDKLIAANRRPARKTKNSAKTAASEALVLPEPAPRRAAKGRKSTGANTSQNGTTRGRRRGRQSQSTIDTFLQNITAPPSRGRSPGRGRSRRRQPNAILNALQALIPVYSVGNTYEYPDQSESQELFSSKQKNDEVVVVEEDPLDDDEELSVKVYWQSSELFKFTIRRYQKLTQIFEYFSNKEKVSFDNLLFTFNDKILKADDTPESIDYNIGKFIDGGVVTKSVSQLVKKDSEENVKDGIKIKFQCQNMKKPIEMTISMDDKMLLSMRKCAEHLDKPMEKLKFVFDGENLSAKSTPRELDFEGGECIDVKILS